MRKSKRIARIWLEKPYNERLYRQYSVKIAITAPDEALIRMCQA
jgi:hypothetical protein